MLKKLIGLVLVVMVLFSLATSCAKQSPDTSTATSGTPAGTDPSATTSNAAPSASSPESNNSQQPSTGGGILKVALTNPFTGASAINTNNPYRYSSLSQVYETLLAFEDGKYVGVLAKEWEKTDDYTWRVTLFDNITDSNGNSFTASDVAFVFDAQKDVGHNLNIYYDQGGVKVINDTTFEFTLTTDSVGAFYLLGTQVFQCTKASYDGSSDNLATMPVGTGPYVCTSYVEGSSCTLEKRSDYWKTENLPRASIANPDMIEISYIPEAVQMSMAIDSGNVQFAGQVALSIASEVDTFKNVTTMYISNGTFNGLGFNMQGRPVSDIKALREAVCYAIDPNGMIASVYSGHGTVMKNYGMPTASDYDASWTTNISYNPDMAKQKLAEAGYPDGITLTLLSNNVGEDSLMAEVVQGYLAAVGITLQFDFVEPATRNARRMEGDWDLDFVGGVGVLDMSLFWGTLYGLVGDTGMSRYFHNDSALYDIYDKFAAVGGKTPENLKALYEYELDHVTWFPMFNKQSLYTFSGGYSDIYLNDGYQAMPYLGSIT